MKYQKSMLKIYELLLSKEFFILEDIIKKTSIGRTAGFKAIEWMKDNGFVNVIKIGRQKQISLRKDRYTLQFKNFIDSLKFKELDESLKYPITLFVNSLKIQSIKTILLFGSSLYNKNPKDIDIMIIYSDKIDRDGVIKIRDKTEILTDFIINIHFENKPSNQMLLNSICLYGFDYYTGLLIWKNKFYEQFYEAMDWFISASNNIKDKNLFDNCFNNLINNLGFVYSSINDITPKTKEEARKIFFEHYRKLNKLENFDNYKKIEILREVLIEIGKEIFK